MAYGTTHRLAAWAAGAVCAPLLLATRSATGQGVTTAVVDASGGTVTIDGFARSTFTAVGARVAAGRGPLRGDAGLSGTTFETGHVSLYGTLRGELGAALTDRADVSVGVDGGGGAYRGNAASRYARTTLRLDVRAGHGTDTGGSQGGPVRPDYGAWVAAAGGGAYDVAGFATARGEVGAWHARSWRALTLATSAAVAGVHANDARYGEVRGTARLLLPQGALEVGTGARAGRRSWIQATVVAALTGSLAAVMSAGDDPPEPDRAITGSRSLTLGLRWTARAQPSRAATALLDPKRTAAAPFVVGDAASDGTRVVRLRASADSVELMGDFTDWHPVPLRRGGDGVWTTRLVIPTGMHCVNVRLNGGEWTAPPGLPTAGDDFGGESGVLVIR